MTKIFFFSPAGCQHESLRYSSRDICQNSGKPPLLSGVFYCSCFLVLFIPLYSTWMGWYSCLYIAVISSQACTSYHRKDDTIPPVWACAIWLGEFFSCQHHRSVIAFNIRRLDDANEITSHMLEVIQAHLHSDKSSCSMVRLALRYIIRVVGFIVISCWTDGAGVAQCLRL